MVRSSEKGWFGSSKQDSSFQPQGNLILNIRFYLQNNFLSLSNLILKYFTSQCSFIEHIWFENELKRDYINIFEI